MSLTFPLKKDDLQHVLYAYFILAAAMPGPPGPPGESGSPATRNLVREQNKGVCYRKFSSRLLVVTGSTERGVKVPSCVFIS